MVYFDSPFGTRQPNTMPGGGYNGMGSLPNGGYDYRYTVGGGGGLPFNVLDDGTGPGGRYYSGGGQPPNYQTGGGGGFGTGGGGLPSGVTLPNERPGMEQGQLDPDAVARQRQEDAMRRFYESPDYQFRFREGQRAMDSSAAARGMLLSGAQLRALNEFGSGLASGEYGNYYNRLAGIAGMAQTPTNPYAGTQAGLYNQMIGAYGQAGANTANMIGAGANSNANMWGNVLGGMDWNSLFKGISGMF